MNRIRRYIRSILHRLFAEEFHEFARSQYIMKRQLEWLTRTCTRAQRRQWERKLRRELKSWASPYQAPADMITASTVIYYDKLCNRIKPSKKIGRGKPS